MQTAEVLQWLIPAILSGGALGGVIVKALNRPVDSATAKQLAAATRSSVQETASSEVKVIRDVLAEVRANDAAKSHQLSAQSHLLTELRQRVEKLEERERHMLTRAAVHEAWDQMAFATLVTHNPAHPPPPPLTPESALARAHEAEHAAERAADMRTKLADEQSS